MHVGLNTDLSAEGECLIIGGRCYSQVAFDCQMDVTLIHNNCVMLFPTGGQVGHPLIIAESQIQNGTFFRAAYLALLRRIAEYPNIQEGPLAFQSPFSCF